MAKDRSKAILREIRNLREEMSTRLDELSTRLDALESGAGAPGLYPPPEPAPDGNFVLPAQSAEAISPPKEFELPDRGDVRVIVQPLHDLSLARVVEEALRKTEGVEEASLTELRGDSATIDTRLGEGVSLVASLRRKLPVAFDVTESSSDSVTIALAQPMGGRESGVAAPTAP